MKAGTWVAACMVALTGHLMAEGKTDATPRVLDARDFASPRSFTGGIQEAIDALPPGGGTVLLPPGVYLLRRSVLLRSGVTVRGEGAASVVRRPPEFKSPLAEEISPGDSSAVLVDAGPLQPGDQVLVKDQKNVGWHARNAVITARDGNTLTLRIINSPPDKTYSPSMGGYCANWFPAFWMWGVERVAIENLVVDGGIERHPEHRSDFVVAAVHARGGGDVSVRNVVVRNWPGDGISIQKTNGALIRDCIVENCRGNGLHPGTGAVNTIWTDNISRFNTRRGFFFCMRVKHAVVKGNLFLGNGEEGIGGLGGGDRFNIVEGNICVDNAGYGIEAVGSACNIIQANVCRDNCREGVQPPAGIYLKNHRDTIVRGNLCVDTRERPLQTLGVVSEEPAGGNVIEGNHVSVSHGRD